MAIANHIQEELRQIAPSIANMDRVYPYVVPPGYFEQLAERALDHAMEGEILRQTKVLAAGPAHEVPAGYFDNLAGLIMEKIQQQNNSRGEFYDELQEVAPLLNKISKENIYHVPPQYFENVLPAKVPAPPQQAKVVAMGAAGNVKRWISYAAAAAVMLFISTTSFLYVNHRMKHAAHALTVEQRLATLKDEEILRYLKNDVGEGDFNATNFSEENPDINHLLIHASDAEIERYLDADQENSDENTSGI